MKAEDHKTILDQTTTQRAMYRCHFPEPACVWEQTETGGWISRAWRPGEKAKYEREVLGREPE